MQADRRSFDTSSQTLPSICSFSAPAVEGENLSVLNNTGETSEESIPNVGYTRRMVQTLFPGVDSDQALDMLHNR